LLFFISDLFLHQIKNMQNILNKLKLTRPLCFIDAETTGLSTSTDKIIEISICKLNIDGTTETKTKRFNPEIPISAEATALHGYTNEMLANEPTFKKVAKGLLAFITDCDIAGFNSNSFDLPMLFFEFQRAGVSWDYTKVHFIDAGNIFKIKEERTLAGAYQFFCNKVLENAHNSESDILATLEVLDAQLAKYEDLPSDMAELAVFSNYGIQRIDIGNKFAKDTDGDLVFNFGENRGKKCLQNVKMLKWIIGKDFTDDVKAICELLIKQVEPTYVRPVPVFVSATK